MNFESGDVPSRAHELFHRLETQGATYVKALVEEKKSEELFLDFKRIATDSSANALNPSDRDNFKKALSGFANSEGGVILWGAETVKIEGVESLKFPDGYADTARFVSLLEDAISGCTVPPVPGVRSIKIPLTDDDSKGLVATLVPASHYAPHQTTDDSRAYFMRAGSSFARVPHGILAGMFGRRPAPKILLNQIVKSCYVGLEDGRNIPHLKFELELCNSSNVVARDAFLSWSFNKAGSRMADLRVTFAKPGLPWHLERSSPRSGSLIVQDGYKLAPYSKYPVLTFDLSNFGLANEAIDIDFHFGCDGAVPGHCRLFIDRDDLKSAVEDLGKLPLGYGDGFNYLKLGNRILGLPSFW
ncbi:hypothetical protein DJFAAGMI_04165 [Comamonas sp. PE63]|uniref:Schlafen AlbA-2 domain-containing protein n=1 Tax=Comamonas brasiliensis TaxID=1812482 RepID=A0ABS5LY05_9BURK|nr:ATP-binding protein [Comamonas sp. PE63]MBS3021393.1 hypothetical protein [Comamonas sp. PE63]